jgi:hypothetical protein
VTLAWTAAVIAALVVVEYALSRPSGGCGPNPDAYCAFAAGAEDATNGFLEVGAFFLAVVVWAVGFVLIRVIGSLVDAQSRRREVRAPQ